MDEENQRELGNKERIVSSFEEINGSTIDLAPFSHDKSVYSHIKRYV